MAASAKDAPKKREAQKRLAFAVTALVHGEERAQNVQKVTEVLFGDSSIDDLNDDQLALLAAEIPTASKGETIVAALAQSGIATSNGEARRLLSGGAVSVNGQKVTEDAQISKVSLLKKGKNSFILVR